MVIKTKLSLSLLFFSVLLSVSLSLVTAREDPELVQCKRQCLVKHQFSEKQKRECEQKCEDYYREKHGGEGEILSRVEDDPRKQLEQCQKQCERQSGKHKEQCQRECRERYEEQQGEEGEGGGRGEEERDPRKQYQRCQRQCRQQEEEEWKRIKCEQQCQQKMREQEEEGGGEEGGGEGNDHTRQQEGQQEENPYVFQDQHYVASVETNEGKVRILQRFNERSRLLNGLENYRFICLEANPQTFMLPNHFDAETVVYVASGRGTISLIRQGRRESFNIRKGDVVRIHAGTTSYLINRDKIKKLRLATLLQPVALPDQFMPFFGAAGENPPSFYRAFSNELLAAAFKVPEERLQRVLTKQNKGSIVKASEQQIQALSQQEEGGKAGMWPFGSSKSEHVFNLLDKEPSISNRYGRLYQVDAEEFKHLEAMNVGLTFVNITKGSIEGPFFNTKATKIAVVVKGDGFMEMACPHVAQQQREGQRGQGGQQGPEGEHHHRGEQRQGELPPYHQIRATLHRGVLFVAPAGHPIIIAAGEKRNLEIACFEVNAEGNRKETLAGDRNVITAMEKAAKELSFNTPAREVDEVFGKNREKLFFPGPRQQGGGRAYA